MGISMDEAKYGSLSRLVSAVDEALKNHPRGSVFLVSSLLVSLLIGGFFLFSSAPSAGAETYTVSSPDGSVSANVFFDSGTGTVSYTVMKDGSMVVENSSLGINTSLENFTSGLSFVSSLEAVIDNTYQIPTGNKSQYHNYANELTLTFSKGGYDMELIFRAYNDGVAYRYRIPGSGDIEIFSENSGFNLPGTPTGWAQSHPNGHGYEGTIYEHTNMGGSDWSAPILFELSGENCWVLLRQAATYGDYVTIHYRGEGSGVFKVEYPEDQDKNYDTPGDMTGPVQATRPFSTPWKVAVISSGSPERIVETALFKHLNPPRDPGLENIDADKPRQATWDWMNYSSDEELIDLCEEMGWNTFIIDAGWERSRVKDAIDYGENRGVDIFVWVDSYKVDTEENIENLYSKWSSWGVEGVKVDFFDRVGSSHGYTTDDYEDTQARMQLRDLLAKKGIKYDLTQLFHGATIPSGEQRRWPHVNVEAVRGEEHSPSTEHSCALPFTRNVLGPMDYTPHLTANLPDYGRHTNGTGLRAHSMAQSFVFETGLQIFAAGHEAYLNSPAKELFKHAYTSWDEEEFIDGYPGRYCIIARRKGEEWFVGAINAGTERTCEVPLDFLLDNLNYEMRSYQDAPGSDNGIDVRKNQVNSFNTITFSMKADGGQVVWLANPSVLSFENLLISRPTIGRGGNTTVSATVQNDSSRNVLENVKLYADGEVEEYKEVSLNAEESKSISFNISFNETGLHSVRIGDLSGSVRVRILGGSLEFPSWSGSLNNLENENGDLIKPSAIAHWSFDGSGQVVTDVSGNGNDGTLGGTDNTETSNPTRTTDGKFENALDFDGTDDYVDVPYMDISTTSLTFSAWINPGNVTGERHIYSDWRGPWAFRFGVESGGLMLQLRGNSGSDIISDTTYGTVDTNTWQHVAVTWDRSSATATYYIDGQEVGTQSGTDSDLMNNNREYHIGWKQDRDVHWDGRIDDLRVYDQALTENGISILYEGTGDEIINSGSWTSDWYELGNVSFDNVEYDVSVSSGENIKLRVSMENNGVIENTGWMDLSNGVNSLEPSISAGDNIRVELMLETENNQHVPEAHSLTLNFTGLAPSAPSGLSASVVSSSEISLDWNNVSASDLDYYNVYKSQSSGLPIDNMSLIDNTSLNSFSDSSLSENTTYYYKMTAVDAHGNESSPSGTASATISAGDSTAPALFELVSPANNATISDNAPTLEWEASSDERTGLDHYEVWLDGSNVENVPTGTTSYATSALSKGTHSWRVTAVDKAGNERKSEEFAFEVPGEAVEPAEFELSNLSVSKTTVEPGESLTVSVLVTNTGGESGSHTAEVSIGGETKSEEVTLDPDASDNMTFDVTEDEVGTYEVSIGDMTQSFEVVKPEEEKPGGGVPVLPVAGAIIAIIAIAGGVWLWRKS